MYYIQDWRRAVGPPFKRRAGYLFEIKFKSHGIPSPIDARPTEGGGYLHKSINTMIVAVTLCNVCMSVCLHSSNIPTVSTNIWHKMYTRVKE